VLFSGQLRPLVTDFGLLLGFIIVQVVALGLHHQYLSTVEHHDLELLGSQNVKSTRSPILTPNTAQICPSVSRVTSSSRFGLVMILGRIPVVRRKSVLLIFRAMSSFQNLL